MNIQEVDDVYEDSQSLNWLDVQVGSHEINTGKKKAMEELESRQESEVQDNGKDKKDNE